MKMFEENLNLKASQHLTSTHEAMQAQQGRCEKKKKIPYRVNGCGHIKH